MEDAVCGEGRPRFWRSEGLSQNGCGNGNGGSSFSRTCGLCGGARLPWLCACGGDVSSVVADEGAASLKALDLLKPKVAECNWAGIWVE